MNRHIVEDNGLYILSRRAKGIALNYIESSHVQIDAEYRSMRSEKESNNLEKDMPQRKFV